MSRKPCTWAEAEKLFPGVEAEWRGMCGMPGTCVPPIGIDVRLEIQTLSDKTLLHVIQIDNKEEWEYPPRWVRHGPGIWLHPIPMTKALANMWLRWFI